MPADLIDLVHLRVSQLNDHSERSDRYARDLARQGMAADKLAHVPTWRDTPTLFDERERTALAWAETVARIAESGVPEGAYEAAAAMFGDKALVDLTITIALMSAYARLGIAFHSLSHAA